MFFQFVFHYYSYFFIFIHMFSFLFIFFIFIHMFSSLFIYFHIFDWTKTIANLDHCRSNLRFGVAESCWFLPVQRFFSALWSKSFGKRILDWSTWWLFNNWLIPTHAPWSVKTRYRHSRNLHDYCVTQTFIFATSVSSLICAMLRMLKSEASAPGQKLWNAATHWHVDLPTPETYNNLKRFAFQFLPGSQPLPCV